MMAAVETIDFVIHNGVRWAPKDKVWLLTATDKLSARLDSIRANEGIPMFTVTVTATARRGYTQETSIIWLEKR